MQTLSIEQFSPKKAELQSLASKYSALEINGLEDSAGYALVDTARKDLKRKRVDIQKTGKGLRDEATQFNRAVMAMEKDLIGIIEPLEKELTDKQERIDQEKDRIARRVLLPERFAKLSEIGIELLEEEILGMDTEAFHEFLNVKTTEFLKEKAKQLQEREDALKREQELEAAKKQAREDAEKAAALESERKAKEAIEREERIKREAEEAIEAEKKKAADERQKLIDDQKRKDDQAKKDKEDAERKAKEDAARLAAEEEKARKNEKYQEFLAKNGYTNEDEFIIQRNGETFTIFKKIDSITL